MRWVMQTFTPQVIDQVFFSDFHARTSFASRKLKYGTENIGDFVYEPVELGEACDGYWVRSKSRRNQKPDLVIYFVSGAMAGGVSVYFYLEYLSMLLVESQSQGFRNPVVFCVDAKSCQSLELDYLAYIGRVIQGYNYCYRRHPSSKRLVMGSGSGGTAVLSMLSHISRPEACVTYESNTNADAPSEDQSWKDLKDASNENSDSQLTPRSRHGLPRELSPNMDESSKPRTPNCESKDDDDQDCCDGFSGNLFNENQVEECLKEDVASSCYSPTEKSPSGLLIDMSDGQPLHGRNEPQQDTEPSEAENYDRILNQSDESNADVEQQQEDSVMIECETTSTEVGAPIATTEIASPSRLSDGQPISRIISNSIDDPDFSGGAEVLPICHTSVPSPDAASSISPLSRLSMQRKSNFPDIVTSQAFSKLCGPIVVTQEYRHLWTSPGCIQDVKWWSSAMPPRGMVVMYGGMETLSREVEQLISVMKGCRPCKIVASCNDNQTHAWPIASAYLGRTTTDQLDGITQVARYISNMLVMDCLLDDEES